MEAVYLYLAFSYLFAMGVTHEFDAPWWVELMLFAFSLSLLFCLQSLLLQQTPYTHSSLRPLSLPFLNYSLLPQPTWSTGKPLTRQIGFLPRSLPEIQE